MNNTRGYTRARFALQYAEPHLREEAHLVKTLAACEEWFREHGIDWDAEYETAANGGDTRMERYQHAKTTKLPEARRQIVKHLRPVHRQIWQVWWEVSRMTDPKPEDERLAVTVNEMCSVITDALLRCGVPQEELEAEQGDELKTEEISEYFDAIPCDPQTGETLQPALLEVPAETKWTDPEKKPARKSRAKAGASR